MKKSLGFWTIFPALLIISGVLLLIFRVLLKRLKAKQTGQTTDEEITDVEEVKDPEPEEEPAKTKEGRIIENYMTIRNNLPGDYSDDVAKMITAQAMHETGIFTSRLYKEQNNLFGMRHPVVRETLSTGEKGGYANFKTRADSVRDLILYFKEFKAPAKYESINDYVKMLKGNGYFTDNYVNYFNPVRTYYNQLKELIQ